MSWKRELCDNLNRQACSKKPSAPYESIEPYAAPETPLEPFEFLSLSTLQRLYDAGITIELIKQIIIESRQWESNSLYESNAAPKPTAPEPIKSLSFPTRQRLYRAGITGITRELINQIIIKSRQRESNSRYESNAAPEPTAPELTDLLSLQTKWSLKRSGFTEEEIGEAVIASHQQESNSRYESNAAPEPTAPELTDLLSLQTKWSLKRSGFTKEEIGEAVIEAYRRES
ncbi:hypothetical protein [Candidatus Regiella insecticola]|nr:hypothetical protein [Candidatus Regiella insecticola]